MKRADDTSKKRTSRLMEIVLLGMLSSCCFSLSAWSLDEAAEPIARSDIVVMDWVALFGELERPPVQFPHDLHTEVMKERNEDCTICHLVDDDGRLSSKYERLGDASEEEIRDLYHENCIGCHQEIADEGAKSGPVDLHIRI